MVHSQLNSRLGFINPGLTLYDCRSKGPCRDRQGSNMRPRENFSWVCERFFLFLGKKIAKDFNMRPSRKINVGVAKDSRKLFVYPRSFQIMDFRSTAIYVLYIYILVYIHMDHIYILIIIYTYVIYMIIYIYTCILYMYHIYKCIKYVYYI